MTQNRSFTKAEWIQLSEAARRLIRAADPIIGAGDGNGRFASITGEDIDFNGIGGNSCENFLLTRDKPSRAFLFCKTERRPYDAVVVAILIYVDLVWGTEILGIGSDGEILADRGDPDPRDERTPAWALIDKAGILGEAKTTPEITTEQAQAYLDKRGADCPVCGDSRIEGDSYEMIDGTIYRSMQCTECGAQWEDAYELNRIVDILDAEWTGEVSA